MTKSIKKVLLMLTTVVLTVVLAACGSGGSSAPKTPTSKEVFEKYSEVAKNIKSAKFIADVQMSDSKGQLTMKMDGTFTAEPLTMLVDYDISNGKQNQKMSMYLKDSSNIYINQGSSGWKKMPVNEATKKQLDSIKDVAGNDKALNFYKNNADSFKVEEEGDNYVLTYTGNDEKFKELLKELGSSSGTSGNYDEFNFKNTTVKLTVKKSNYEPVASEVSTELESKKDSKNITKLVTKQTFSEINSAKVTAPEGVK
ncbi:DUF6612 family protein [Gemella sanguinis]|uniref:DUF6612 family protein n=1 Tax=Gemella sanguinis TaxID=84135 RepID=UPI00080765CE|nr:DUF6612 family protein [Gemella sanguinis]